MRHEEIGGRIKRRRMELDISAAELASRLSMSKATVHRWENGEIKNIKIPVVMAIAHELKVNAAWLLGNQGVLNELQKEGKSASYITLVRVVMRSAFAYAVSPLGYIKDNPAASAKTPKNTPKPKTRRVVSREEMDRILERFDGTGFRLPVLIAYHAGLRIGEVYGLTWDDIDLQAGTVSVRKQLKQYRKRWYFSEPKNDASIRTVLVGKTLVDALREERELQQKERAELGEYYQDTRDLVNAKRGGGFYTPNSFTYASRIIRFELGIQDFDFHSIRHTHATMLIEAGANIKDVSARLGHSRVETTLQIYTHQTESMSEKTVDIFERLTAE